MDPNANIEEQLELAERFLAATDADDDEIAQEDAARLAELVIALDGWIRSGGFLPARWPGAGTKR